MCRGNGTALKDQQEKQGPEWLWERSKDQKESDRIQGKRGNSVGLGCKTYSTSEHWTLWRHLKYGWLSELHCYNIFQEHDCCIINCCIKQTNCCIKLGMPMRKSLMSLKYTRYSENVCGLQSSWKKHISGISISWTFGAHLGMAEMCPVEGFNMQWDW